MEVIFATDCREAFERAGLDYPEREPEPGRLCRFPTNGRKDDDAGWLRIFSDQDGAVFGNWRSGAEFTWQRKKDGPPPSATELAAIRQKAEEARKAAEAEREAGYQEAAKKAAATWQAAEPAQAHPYLAAKSIAPHIARERGGWLVIPVFDKDGAIQSVQSVSPTGEKRFMQGGKMAGGRCWIGEPNESGPLLVAEGYATAATLHEAAGFPVCVAFNAGNIRAVALSLREQFPRAHIVIAGDDDRATEGNPGREKATEAARLVKAIAVFPIFASDEGSDFNDMAQQAGSDAVKRQILASLEKPADQSGAVQPINGIETDQPQPDDHEALIAALSALPLVEYEQRRAEAAKQIGVRASILDKLVKDQRPVADDAAGNAVLFPEITPWASPVNGEELLDDLSALIRRYLVAPKHADHAMALWIVFTHAIEAADVAPILMLKSAEKRCGKTTALTLIQRLSYRALPAANITAPALFRSIEAWAPTLLIDEADMFLKDSPELNGIINSGHTRPTAFVIRTVGEDFEPRRFSTWGAKAIASIGGQSTTLHDRSIIIELRRKLPGESAEKLRHADRRDFERMTQRIVRFSSDNQARFGAHHPSIPDVLNDRAADNWEFLLAIADVAGGRWPELARRAAIALSGAADDVKSVGQELLEDIREIFDHKRVDRISTGQLLEALCEDDEKSWAAYNRGKPMTAKQLAKRLHEFKIISRTVRIGHATPKGYLLSDFDDAFARYAAATPDSPATPPQPAPNKGLSVAGVPQHAATQNTAATLEPAPLLGCGVVAGDGHVLEEEADEWL